MEIQVGVKVMLKNGEGQYLMLRRSDKEKRGTGKWDIAGGRMEPGASMLENLAREVQEETQLTMQSTPMLLGVQDMIWPDRHVVRATYVSTAEGEPTLSWEHSEFKWMSIDEILNLVDEEFDRYLRQLIEEKIFLLR